MSFKPYRFLSSATHQYLLVTVIITLAALLCFQLAQNLGYYIVSFILLILVSILATFMRTGPVLLASLISILAWNFFFIPPHYTFHIDKTEDILMFSMFGLVVIMNGVFTTRVRRQEELAREKEVNTGALFQLTRELSKAGGIDEVVKVSADVIEGHFFLRPVILVRDINIDQPSLDRGTPGNDLPEEEFNIAEWIYIHGRNAGQSQNMLQPAGMSFYPLQGALVNPGIVVLRQNRTFSGEKEALWNTFLVLISNAMERELLGDLARKAKFLDESDRFYKTLFNSVSHELRIPVSTILAASDTLVGSQVANTMQAALSKEIYSATLRLNRLIENLLNMSRLESGRIALRLDWHDLNDLVYKVVNDLKEELKTISLRIDIPENMPLVRIDFGLMEQVLFNLIYNACQYAPATSEVVVAAGYKDGHVILRVSDKGPGFPPAELEHVFNKFFRANERRTGGLGLGLSIVKGFAEAHKGRVFAANRPGGGAEVTVTIPSDLPDITDISTEKSDV